MSVESWSLVSCRAQREADLAALEALRDQLPREHRELAGVIRAIEVLRHEPLALKGPRR